MIRPRTQATLPPAKGVLPVLLLVLHVQLPARDETAPRFADVSRAAGLEFVHRNQVSEPDPKAKYLIETMGSGGGILDYDGDGWMDVYLVNGQGSNRLFRNRRDGTFSDVTDQAGVGDPSYGMGCTFGDYDNDGHVDIYVTNVGPNVLYRNLGNGAFQDVSRRSGAADSRWGTSAAFADYDGDGLLDLYLANYLEFSFQGHEPCYFQQIPIYCYPHGFDGVGNVLYRNLGGRTFIDVTRSAGLREDARYSKSLGVLWLDLDRDGDQDLYVANDTTGNYLFRNQGDGSFQDVSLESGTALGGSGMAQAGMGVDAGDLDGGGRFHVLVTNYSLQYNALYWNEGGEFFSDRIIDTGLSGPSFVPLGFGANFFDADNDGDLDLFVANGHVLEEAARANPGSRYRQANQLFLNDGKGRFAEAGDPGGYFSVRNVSRGSAVGDFNNDGKLDLLVTNCGGKTDLLENRTPGSGNWIRFRLRGSHCNRDAVGARVTLGAGNLKLTRELRSAGSYLSQSDPRLHFGLGRRSKIDSIRISWPCGKAQGITPPQPLNRTIFIQEP